MKYIVSIDVPQTIEVDAENENAAIEAVKSKLDPRIVEVARYQVVKELIYDSESNSYKVN